MTRMSVAEVDAALLFDPWKAFEIAVGGSPLEWQRPYLWEDRATLVLKGRQVGASTSAGVVGCRYARMNAGSLVAIVSPSQKQSTEVKERTRKSALALGLTLVRDSETELRFDNRSRVLSLPGTPKSVRGWSADLLVVDEAAFLDPETFMAARATVAATGGRVIVQSTPAGPFGHFYELWKEGVDYADAMLDGTSIPDPTVRWVRFRVSSEEAGNIDPAFLASEKATMSAEEYAQEYLGEFGSPGLGLVDPKRLDELTEKAAATTQDDLWARLRS